MHHSWQLIVVKSDVHTVERAGLLDQLSGRNQEVANTSNIVSAVCASTLFFIQKIVKMMQEIEMNEAYVAPLKIAFFV